jgi:alpha-glucosidase
VAALRSDRTSILHLYRRLLAARRASPALQAGNWRLLDSPADVLAYDRGGEDPRRVVASFRDGDEVDVGDGNWVIEVATCAEREGTLFDGRLTGPEAVLLRRARS